MYFSRPRLFLFRLSVSSFIFSLTFLPSGLAMESLLPGGPTLCSSTWWPPLHVSSSRPSTPVHNNNNKKIQIIIQKIPKLNSPQNKRIIIHPPRPDNATIFSSEISSNSKRRQHCSDICISQIARVLRCFTCCLSATFKRKKGGRNQPSVNGMSEKLEEINYGEYRRLNDFPFNVAGQLSQQTK